MSTAKARRLWPLRRNVIKAATRLAFDECDAQSENAGDGSGHVHRLKRPCAKGRSVASGPSRPSGDRKKRQFASKDRPPNHVALFSPTDEPRVGCVCEFDRENRQSALVTTRCSRLTPAKEFSTVTTLHRPPTEIANRR
jgi:hypothetical protein